jgi:hypothetical protein
MQACCHLCYNITVCSYMINREACLNVFKNEVWQPRIIHWVRQWNQELIIFGYAHWEESDGNLLKINFRRIGEELWRLCVIKLIMVHLKARRLQEMLKMCRLCWYLSLLRIIVGQFLCPAQTELVTLYAEMFEAKRAY